MNLYCPRRRTPYKLTNIFLSLLQRVHGKEKKGKIFISMNKLYFKKTHTQTCIQLLTISTASIEAFIPAEN
jgi:hypothetical protein